MRLIQADSQTYTGLRQTLSSRFLQQSRANSAQQASSNRICFYCSAKCLLTIQCGHSPPQRSWKLVKEKIDVGNLAVPGDNEIGSGISRRLAGAARHPTDPSSIAYHFRRGERLISEVRMRSLDHARNAVDLVATAIIATGLMEHGVLVEDFVDHCASTR